jgi:threonine aldolase
VLAGTPDFVAAARRIRKLLGGGMRQAGVFASGGLYAIQHHRSDFARDHANAKRFANALAAAGLPVVPPDSNIVLWRVPGRGAYDVVAQAEALGVRISCIDTESLRVVMHRDVSDAEVDFAAGVLAKITM